jgi:starch-binding outer membrane protein, SusD/RagB family
LNAYLNYEKTILLQLQGATFDAMDKLFPIPQRQIDLSGPDILTQNPGY